MPPKQRCSEITFKAMGHLPTLPDRILRRTDDYAALRERLERLARALLGPDAEVTGHPEGGVVARAPGRRVDLSLPALADRALDRLGGEVRALWEP